MLPGDGIPSSVDISGRFLKTDARRTGRLEDWERGGVAVNDASQGLDVHDWRINVEPNGDVRLTPDGGAGTVLFSTADISEIALAFDQNMRPAVGYVQDGMLKLRWYDTTVSAYRVVEFFQAKNPKLTLDDKRRSRSGEADIIFAYVRNRALYYRQQRDRFEVEYLLQDNLAPDEKLVNIGMSRNWRLQFQMG